MSETRPAAEPPIALKPPAAAAFIGISLSALDNLRRMGELSPVYPGRGAGKPPVPGRGVSGARYRRADLERYIADLPTA